jgi:hypothetical protein
MSAFAIEGPGTLTLTDPSLTPILRVTNGLGVEIAQLWWSFKVAGTKVSNFVWSVQPGQTVDLPLTAAGLLSDYVVAAFDLNGRMVARYPQGSGTVARHEGLPEDAWARSGIREVLLDANLATDPQMIYQVHIRNSTPDTWEEVTLAYADANTGTALFASSTVSPGGVVTFDTTRVFDLVGYVFSIWTNGLRAYLGSGPGAPLQFPPTGTMSPWLAASRFGKLDAYSCSWEIEPGRRQ